MNDKFDPWKIDNDKFGELIMSIMSHEDDCECDTCVFVDMIPSILGED